jgi:hypothetical protein
MSLDIARLLGYSNPLDVISCLLCRVARHVGVKFIVQMPFNLIKSRCLKCYIKIHTSDGCRLTVT